MGHALRRGGQAQDQAAGGQAHRAAEGGEFARATRWRRWGFTTALTSDAERQNETPQVSRPWGQKQQWRRRESNPRPRVLCLWRLRAFSAVYFSNSGRPPMGFRYRGPGCALIPALPGERSDKPGLSRTGPAPQAGLRLYGVGPFFRRPARARRCRWLLWFCPQYLRGNRAPRHATRASTPTSKPFRPQFSKNDRCPFNMRAAGGGVKPKGRTPKYKGPRPGPAISEVAFEEWLCTLGERSEYPGARCVNWTR